MIIGLTLVAAIFYTLFAVFISKAGGKINDSLAAAIGNGIGMAIPLVTYLIAKNRGALGEQQSTGIVYAVLAGVSIAIFSILLVNIFSRGENLSYVLPAIYGTSIVLGSLIGIFAFKQATSGIEVFGLLITVVGIGVIIYSRAFA